jgi:prepilin-type N-terminal cleavage/methylation domain-containing protein
MNARACSGSRRPPGDGLGDFRGTITARDHNRTPRPAVAGYLRSKRGFTLFEMVITVVILLVLAGMVFVLMTGILTSAATLEDNQNRNDQLTALDDFIKTKLMSLPARSTIASYARGDGEGLVQNGIIFGNTNLATAIDGKIQPNGLYLLRLTTFATTENSQESQDARVTLTQAVTTDDPTLTWTELIKDVKTMAWKFQDPTQVQWDTAWTANNTPNLIEFDMQGGGDRLPTTMDFWVPKINPISVHIQANPGAPGGGGHSGTGTGGQGPPRIRPEPPRIQP